MRTARGEFHLLFYTSVYTHLTLWDTLWHRGPGEVYLWLRDFEFFMEILRALSLKRHKLGGLKERMQ